MDTAAALRSSYFTTQIALRLAVICEVAFSRAENEMRDLAAGIQKELDRPRGRIESGLGLWNERKVLHIQLSLVHADDLCAAEERRGCRRTFSILIYASIPCEQGGGDLRNGLRRAHQVRRILLVLVADVLQQVRVRRIGQPQCDRERLGKRLGVVIGNLKLNVT